MKTTECDAATRSYDDDDDCQFDDCQSEKTLTKLNSIL